MATELPVWGRLDREGSWREYASAIDDDAVLRRVRALADNPPLRI
jgi:hypothetical protein